jgi:U3 small nucleolar RNA-associated protein 14
LLDCCWQLLLLAETDAPVRFVCLQQVDNYEYELPSDFEDEEIDEEMAFTAEDKKLYAGWFGEEEEQQAGSDGDGDAGQQRRSKRSKLGEFADLESSSEEEQEGEDVEVGHAHWQGAQQH